MLLLVIIVMIQQFIRCYNMVRVIQIYLLTLLLELLFVRLFFVPCLSQDEVGYVTELLCTC